MPNRPDVARVESELLELSGCLLGGAIGTFDDLFERIAASDPARRQVATQAQRALIARRAVAAALRGGTPLSASARFSGFADSLLAALSDLEGGLLEPGRSRRRPRCALCRVPGRARPPRALGSRAPSTERLRATARRPRCVERRARLRVRLRRSDRRRMVAARGARRPLPRSRSRCPTSRAALRSPRSRVPRPTWPPSPPAGSRSCRRGRPSSSRRRSRISSARSSRPSPSSRPIGGAVAVPGRGGRPRDARARRRPGARRASRRRSRPSRSGSSSPPSSAGGHRSRP